jgi:hypothetical protein
VKYDLDGKPIRIKKCAHCGKPKGDHQARGYHCPIGFKHRTLGYNMYHATKVFTEKSR